MSAGSRVAPSRLTYDAIVFGGELAGAVAAALLARRGHRVLAIAHGAPPPSYRDQGFVLPSAPTLMPMLRQLPAGAALVDELGLGQELARTEHPVTPALQLLTASSRLELPADPASRAAELGRELGAAAGEASAALEALALSERALDPFFARPAPLPAQGLFERWRHRQALSKEPRLGAAAPGLPGALAEGTPLGAALLALWQIASGSAEERPPSLPALRPLELLLRGAATRPGGALGLARELRARVPGWGGELFEGPGAGSRVQAIELEGRRLAAVRLSGSPHEYRATLFVAALPGGELRELLPASAATSKLATTAGAARPRRALAVLNLVVAEAGVPVGLGRAALLAVAGAPGLLVEQLPVEREEGETGVPARVLLLSREAPIERLASEAQARELLREMRAEVERYFPFLARHVLAESSPLLGDEAPLATALQLHSAVEVGLPAQLGVTGLPLRSPAPNLLFASREVLPGLGLEGELLTGLAAAAQVERKLPKKRARLSAR